jgi:hypothetical protein
MILYKKYSVKEANFMIKILFPKTIDNNYRGAPVAKWVFVALVAMTVVRSLAHIFLPDGGAQSIATIPLDDFTSNGASAIVHIFALWGLSQLLFGLLYVVVLWRYQTFIPLMWLFIIIEYIGRMLLTITKPFEIMGTAPGAVGNYILIPLSLLMFGLSLKDQISSDQSG